MKNILVVAYYFPPSGGPGVQRVLKHVKYLPDFGYNPIVLTVEGANYPAIDESLFEQIPEGTIIKRTTIPEPYNIYRKFLGLAADAPTDVNTIKQEGSKSDFKNRVAEFIRATFFIPDARVGWLKTARPAVRELVRKHNIQAVYSSSPPYTVSLIARYAKRKFKLPWVAGFRDPWTGFISSPKRWFLPAWIDKRMEYTVFNEADQIECAWRGIVEDVIRKFPELLHDKFHHVPNGFDSDDFPNVTKTRNEKFTITYTGSMYGRRNPKSLFEAVQKLVDAGRVWPEKLLFRFVGRFGDEIHEIFKNSGFMEQIEVIDYVPHKKSLEHLMTSDVLLLIVDESKESNKIVPGKVFEYIGVKRPIIAIAPDDSEIADLIAYANSGKSAHQSDIEQLAAHFKAQYDLWYQGTQYFEPDIEIVESFERREATRQLAEILDTLIEKKAAERKKKKK